MSKVWFGKRARGETVPDTPAERKSAVDKKSWLPMEATLYQTRSDVPKRRVLVIEDEPLIALDLVTILEEDLGHDVVGVARTLDNAVALFDAHLPDLLVSDIQLADGSSGIDACNTLLRRCSMPVVFISAYPEALTPDVRPNPFISVPKPVQSKTVRTAIDQAVQFRLNAEPGRGRCCGKGFHSPTTQT